MRKYRSGILLFLLFVLISGSLCLFGASAAGTDIVLSYPTYSGGIASHRQTATCETVTFDGKKAVKVTPNPESTESTRIYLDSWSYGSANINLEECLYVSVEYYYSSPDPITFKPIIQICSLGGILSVSNVQYIASEDCESGKWVTAVFSLSGLTEKLAPGASHNLRQMYIMPYGNTELSTLTTSDIVYVNTVTFHKSSQNVRVPFDLTFEKGDPAAEGEEMTVRVMNGESTVLPACPFTLEGYKFAGWQNRYDGRVYPAGETFNVSAVTVFAALWNKDDTRNFVSLDFTRYCQGIASHRQTATAENTSIDGVSAVKVTPNPASAESPYIYLDGWSYLGAGIDLSEYRFLTVEYLYVSDSPKSTSMQIELCNKNSVLRSSNVTYTAKERLVPGAWSLATFDLSDLEGRLNPDAADHFLRQMYVKPFGTKTLQTLSANDIIYISRLTFYKESMHTAIHNPYMQGYPDGSFRPSAGVSRAEACAMIARLLESEENIMGQASFSDVSDSAWYAKYVGFLCDRGFYADSSGNFSPEEEIFRDEFARLLFLAMTFSDASAAPEGADLADRIGNASETSEGLLTRAEAASMVNRALGRTICENIAGFAPMIFSDVEETQWFYGDIFEAAISHESAEGECTYIIGDPASEIQRKAGEEKMNEILGINAGKEIVARLDDLETARIAAIRNTASDLSSVTGKLIYVSSSGSDANNGLSPEKAVRTVACANILATYGDGILFKRGDVFREKFTGKAGVTYSAYGEGAKPVLLGSPENGADASKWTLYYQNAASGVKVWQFYQSVTGDVGNIILNEGDMYGYKEMPDFRNGNYCVPSTSTPFSAETGLHCDLAFFHNAKNGTDSISSPPKASGTLYFRCDRGNPGTVFDSIEFATAGNIISGCPENVTVDNLCIKYGGSHGIGVGTVKNLRIKNCEIGWIGGSTQNYNSNGTITRFGNGIEVYGGCDGYVIENCFVYQCYDAGVTFQFSGNANGDCEESNILYKDNVITDCVYNIEYFLTTPNNIVYRRFGRNVLFEGNLLRRAGFGFGSTRPNRGAERNIRSGPTGNIYENFVIRDNVLDRSTADLFCTNAAYDSVLPVFEGNTYIQGAGNALYDRAGATVSEAPVTDLTARHTIADVLGDRSGKVYIVEPIPLYEYTGYAESVFGESDKA